MDKEKRHEPRPIPAEREALAAKDDREGDTDTGNYITKLANHVGDGKKEVDRAKLSLS